MQKLRRGITAPKGFLAAGIHAGIKKPPLLDMALITSVVEGPIAGVFTTNRLPAAPVILDRRHLKRKVGRAIIINSGNANACTGLQGLRNAEETAQRVANQLGCLRQAVYVGSTGVIGPTLPMPFIQKGIPLLVRRLRRSGGREAAQAILTTDTKVKEVALEGSIGGQTIRIGGMAKGAGMIHPDMATMLAYLTTDIAIEQKVLQTSLQKAVHHTFNCISVDGDTSTNDTVLCLANGLAGNRMIRSRSSDLNQFQRLLEKACHSLAMQICRDGEGATKFVDIQVHGAKTNAEAKQIAITVATSLLVKTALFGEDPNWGRVIAAVGRAGPSIRADTIHLSFNDIVAVNNGEGCCASLERRIHRIMRRKTFTLTITVGKGKGSATVWTTDLSFDYVKINASYRS